jgi:hypothetical protein
VILSLQIPAARQSNQEDLDLFTCGLWDSSTHMQDQRENQERPEFRAVNVNRRARDTHHTYVALRLVAPATLPGDWLEPRLSSDQLINADATKTTYFP